MSPTPAACGTVRSAADVNREIRALWATGVLEDRERYHRLVVEWADAVRRDGVEAA